MNLEQALEELTTTYQSLDLVARGLVVDSKEVSDALSLAEPDTADFVALSVLSKYNPYTPQKKTTTNADTVK